MHSKCLTTDTVKTLHVFETKLFDINFCKKKKQKTTTTTKKNQQKNPSKQQQQQKTPKFLKNQIKFYHLSPQIRWCSTVLPRHCQHSHVITEIFCKTNCRDGIQPPTQSMWC